MLNAVQFQPVFAWPARERRIFACACLGAMLAFPSSGHAQTCQPAARQWQVTGLDAFSRKKFARNLSGLACAPPFKGKAECLLVQDEDFEAAKIRMKAGTIALQTVFDLPRGTDKKTSASEFDAEAAAYYRRHFYVLGSHSVRASSCLQNPDAAQFVRFKLPRAGVQAKYETSKPLLDIFGALPEISPYIRTCLGSKRPANAKGDWTPAHGLNVEGLALAQGKAFFGLRGPIRQDKAIIVSVPLTGLFGKKPAKAKVHSLAFSPRGGVRDMAAIDQSRPALLILSGSEDDDPGGAAIHFWDSATNALRKLCDIPDPPKDAQDEPKPEALLVLGTAKGVLNVLVLSDGPRGGAPREFAIPMPR